jgi:sporulation protein YlmC with PRC-barrel domain
MARHLQGSCLSDMNRLIFTAALAFAAACAQAGDWEGMRATQFLDAQVVNRQGEKVGAIRELVINMGTGRVHYAVLASDELIPWPLRALSPGRNGNVVLDVRPNELWPSRNQPAWDQAADKNTPFIRARELLGRKVLDRNGHGLGVLQDLVLDLASGDVLQAYILGDRERLVPLEKLRIPGAAKEPLVAEIDP